MPCSKMSIVDRISALIDDEAAMMLTLPCAIMYLYIMIRISCGRWPKLPNLWSTFSHSSSVDFGDILDVSKVVMMEGFIDL